MSEETTQHFFDLAIQELRALRMTAEERARILTKIHTTAPTHPGAENFLGMPPQMPAPQV